MFRRATPRTEAPSGSQRATAITRPLAQPDAPSLHEQAERLTFSLSPDALALLIEASAPLLFGQADPYAPQPQAQRLAQWLRDEVGLLTPVSAGYVPAYRPTALGLCVLWRLLVDNVHARRHAILTPAPTRPAHGWRR